MNVNDLNICSFGQFAESSMHPRSRNIQKLGRRRRPCSDQQRQVAKSATEIGWSLLILSQNQCEQNLCIHFADDRARRIMKPSLSYRPTRPLAKFSPAYHHAAWK